MAYSADVEPSLAALMARLRRGLGLMIDGQAYWSAELCEDADLAALRAAGGVCAILLTRARAGALHTPASLTQMGGDSLALALPPDADAAWVRALGDATQDFARPLRGPFVSSDRDDGAARADDLALRLMRRARLLPAALVARGLQPQDKLLAGAPMMTAETLERALDRADRALDLVARVRLPVHDAQDAWLHIFRPLDGGPEHTALVIGDPPRDQPVLTRLHSECFTGDVLGSLRCDCGEQLNGAIRLLREAGGGVLLYLAQEGRGIGLANKLRAYALQDQGFDTFEANARLGFAADERLFAPAAAMLRALGIARVRLLTNNPDKVAGLIEEGIAVEERVGHAFPPNVHNEAYLMAKKKKSGHFL